jgi:hypothetical protein
MIATKDATPLDPMESSTLGRAGRAALWGADWQDAANSIKEATLIPELSAEPGPRAQMGNVYVMSVAGPAPVQIPFDAFHEAADLALAAARRSEPEISHSEMKARLRRDGLI